MRTGLMIGASDGPDGTISGLIKVAQDAEAKGYDNVWMANIFGLDAISTLSLLGHATTKLGLGTAVTPTYPRHPTAIAQQALTTAAASDNRFSLGIGLSHKVVIEDMLGFSYDKPARHMREYLTVLGPLLKGESVSFAGEHFKINNVKLDVPGASNVPILVAALGPVMLKLAGELADGTVTWMTGPNTLADHIIPGIGKGAAAVGKPSPTIAAGFPIVLTNNADEAKAMIDRVLSIYGMLPSYRAMLDKEGAAGPSDVAIVGDEASLRASLKHLKEVGVTDLCASIVAEDAETYQRTFDFLAAENV
ncbi:MAG: 5,10-methylenetetrahydromethanopterin reductase [Patiriisocius sp.]|jgi:5,10-methylenetetrahydromethanopterin reductase